MSKNYGLGGIASSVELGQGLQRVRASGGALEARNNADSAYVNVAVLDPTSNQHAATKNYVDTATAGIGAFWSPVDVVSSSNITLSGEQTIDGVLTSTSRVLVRGQTTASENGIYVSAAGAWSRAADANADDEFKQNKSVSVSLGDTCSGCVFAYTDGDDPDVGVDSLTFTNKAHAAQIADGSITTAKLASDAVTNAKIADDAVDATSIADDAVGTAALAPGAVTATELATDSVTTAKILDANVTAAKLATDSVTTAKILDANVTTAKLADGAATAAKLAADSVTTVKILDANVTAAKLATDAVTTVKILDANVTTAKLAADAVTNAKLADDAVQTENIADAAVTNALMAANSVDSDQYVDGSIDTEHLAQSTLDGLSQARINTDRATITYNGGATQAITGTLPANSFSTRCMVKVETAFDGTTPTLEIGVSGTQNLILETSQVDLDVVGLYEVGVIENISSVVVNGYLTVSGASQGSAKVLLQRTEGAY